jgi:hypothetical protein
MPIAGLTDLIAPGASHKDPQGGSKFIEPVKRNNARLRITTGNLLKVLKAQFQQDEAYLETIGKALEGDVYPLDVTFTPPAISTETRRFYGLNNITVNYGGYTSFGACSCSFNNFIGADTYRFFYRWALLPGAITLQQNDTTIEPVEPPGALPLPDLSSLQSGYKVNGTISQYYTSWPLDGDEVEYHKWILQGLWPSSVTTTGFDLGSDFGSMVQTSVEFTVDLALPCRGLERGNIATAPRAGLAPPPPR